MNKIKYIFITLCLTLAVSPVWVLAQSERLPEPTGPGTSPEKPLITCGDDKNPCDVNDLNGLMMNILKLAFVFAGFIVAIMFMYAGFLLITAAGDMGQIQKAKDIFRRVIIGFLIMFLSYIVIKNLLEHIGVIDFFKKIIQ